MRIKKESIMDLVDAWSEMLVILIVLVVLLVMGGTFFNQFLEKARLTLSVAALNKAQETLKSYKSLRHSFPATLDLGNCSDQDHRVVFNCAEIKSDIDSFVSYAGSAEKFVLKAKAKDSRETLITVTEATISF